MNEERKIEIGHGSGGEMSSRLIREVFARNFGNIYLQQEGDSAILKSGSEIIAVTTDSYVISPLFFPGGDLGKLAVCGTVNDLAVAGARPKYLTAGFMLEEGLEIDILERIVKSMKREADLAHVKIVAGDTKVVGKGQLDQIYINTSGIGIFDKKNRFKSEAQRIKNGDAIIISGIPGEHEAAIINAREKIFSESGLVSDCASLNGIIADVLQNCEGIKFIRDITRGGTAGILNEIAKLSNKGMEINENAIPLSEALTGFCEMLGYDPMNFASEGKFIMITEDREADKVLKIIRAHNLGENASIIGTIKDGHPGEVVLNTTIGGQRLLSQPLGSQVPRIC